MKIADHIQYAEPIGQGSNLYKAIQSDGSISAIEILHSPLSFQQIQIFEERVSIIKELHFHYKASVPKVLSWGFTKTGSLPYVEMEWIEGPTLTQIQNEKIVLSIEEVSKVTDEISRVIALCHKLHIIHGNITTDTVLWDTKNNRYLVTGFLSILQPAASIHKQNIIVLPPVQPAVTEKSDVKSVGMLLLKLLTGCDFLMPSEEINIERNKRLPIISSNETSVPYWLRVAIDKALGRDEVSFENAIQLYIYILKHYKPPQNTNRFYRSQPQPYFDRAKKQVVNHVEPAVKNLTDKQPTSLPKSKEEWRFIFEPKMGAGLLIAILLLAFSIHLQNRENKAKRENHLAQINSHTYVLDSNTLAAKTSDTFTVASSQFFNRTVKKHKKIITTRMQKSAFTPSDTLNGKPLLQINASRDIGIYKVRSVAYFHNAPDESTRRNAFINHWNNAHLHPLKEQNGFVYIVYTNDEGQTSKGWLKLSDLIKQ